MLVNDYCARHRHVECGEFICSYVVWYIMPFPEGEIIQALSCVLIHHSPQESGVTRHWADRVAMWGLETVDWNIDLDMGYEMVRW